MDTESFDTFAAELRRARIFGLALELAQVKLGAGFSPATAVYLAATNYALDEADRDRLARTLFVPAAHSVRVPDEPAPLRLAAPRRKGGA